MRHPHMELNFRQVRQFARTLLQQLQGVAIIAFLEQNPTQRVGYMRLVRDSLSRLLRQVIRLIKLSHVRNKAPQDC